MDQSCSATTCGGDLGVVEQCLRDILTLIKPLEIDRTIRMNTISSLAASLGAVKSLEGATIKPFGSFVSNLYTKWGDLDISIQFVDSSAEPMNNNRKKRLLRDIWRALRRNGATRSVEFIPSARVPLVKLESTYSGISCDISINNHLGLMKSKIFLWITEIDERFRDIVLLTKEWAKAQNINDPKSGTLNSYSLCLLIIFHLQTCKPALLPPLKEIYTGNISDDITGFTSERHIEDVCAANIRRIKSESFSRRNKSSLSQLLISFFDKFAHIESLAMQYAICTYSGQFESIRSIWTQKSYSFIVEDPFEQSENAARAVGLKELSVIAYAFRDAYDKLSSASVLSDRNSLIATLTKPSISSQLRSIPQVKFNAHGVGTPHPRSFFGHETSNGGQHPASSLPGNLRRNGNAVINQQMLPNYEKVEDHCSQFQNAAKQDRQHGRVENSKGQFQTVAKQDSQHQRAEDSQRQTAVRGDWQEPTTPLPGTFKRHGNAAGVQRQQQVWRPKLPSQ